MKREDRTLVLVSGGLDSAVLLAWAVRRAPVASLTFDFPGRPQGEKRAARRLLDHYGVKGRITAGSPSIGGDWVAGSTDQGYVPVRNLYFHAVAHLVARRLGCRTIAAGHRKEDAQDFPDASRRYLQAVTRLANQDQGPGQPRVRLALPLYEKDKRAVVRLARAWNVPTELSWSCFRDGPRPCGRCASCRETADALKASGPGGPDPARPRAVGGGRPARPRRRV